MNPYDRNYGDTFVVPLHHCPICGVELDRATAYQHDCTPKAGDFSVCLCCGQILRFGAELEPRAAESLELLELDVDSRAHVLQTQALIRGINAAALYRATSRGN